MNDLSKVQIEPEESRILSKSRIEDQAFSITTVEKAKAPLFSVKRSKTVLKVPHAIMVSGIAGGLILGGSFGLVWGLAGGIVGGIIGYIAEVRE